MIRKWQISKTWGFDAAHCLFGLPAEHPCSRLHGHSYKVRVTFGADELSETGFVIDYRDVSKMNKQLHGLLDHRNLNDVLVATGAIENTSAELICKWLWAMYSAMLNEQYAEDMHISLCSVELWETDDNHCIYRGIV